MDGSAEGNSKQSEAKITIDPSGIFCLNGAQIPFNQLIWFFKEFGKVDIETVNSSNYFCSRYLEIGNNRYSLDITDNIADGRKYEFTKNGRLHCTYGPAKFSSNGSDEWYIDGHLHRLDGPATVKNGRYVWALNGYTFDKVEDWIDIHPRAICNSAYHKEKFAFTSQVNDLMVVKTSGHSFLFERTTVDAKASPVDFLLGSIWQKPRGFKLVEYKPPNSEFKEIYESLKGLKDWKTREMPDKAFLYGLSDINQISIEYDKYKDRMWFKRTAEHEASQFTIDVDSTGADFVHQKGINLAVRNQPPTFINDINSKWNSEAKTKKASDSLQNLIIDYSEWYDLSSLDYPLFNFNEEKIDIYGYEVGINEYDRSIYNDSDKSYSWLDENGRFHNEKNPAVIFPSGRLYFYYHGIQHCESGPAVRDIYGQKWDEYWLWGTRVSKEEFEHYDPATKAIHFFNSDGELHREDGPARIEFHKNGIVESFFKDGKYHYHVNSSSERLEGDVSKASQWNTEMGYKVEKKKPRVVRVTKKGEASKMAQGKYSELNANEVEALKEIFRDNIEHLRKYEAEIHAAANKALEKKGYKEPVKEAPKKEVVAAAEDKEMSNVDTRKRVRSAPDLTGTRTEQVVNGFKFGFKKGVVNNSSQILAEKLSSYTPLEGNEWFERFVQICVLLGTAEMMKRMPEGFADKIKLDEETRMNLSSLLIFASGENIGRDIVDIMANVLPLFAEVLKDVTTEELADLKKDFEATEDEDEELSEEDNLFSNMKQEHVVAEEVGVHA